MCQLCDEADAYLAQLEARAKMQAEGAKAGSDRQQDVRHVDSVPPTSEGGTSLKKIASKARVY